MKNSTSAMNLYTKRVEWNIDDKNETIITIRQNFNCPIRIKKECKKFDIMSLCMELYEKFNIQHASLTKPQCGYWSKLFWPNKYASRLQIVIQDPKEAYEVLKYFLDNTDINLLDDEYLDLVRQKSYAEYFKTDIYGRYKERLEEYKNMMLKGDSK